MKTKRLFIISTILFCLALFIPSVNALNMDSSSYHIQGGNVNIGSSTASASANLAMTLGQLAAGSFASSGYVVKAGFQYIHSIVPFSFSISDTNIDFGELISEVAKTDTANLRVSFGGAGNYQVTAIEEGPLRTYDNVPFDDTSCDTDDCDEITASVWDMSTTHGFGYNMTGQDIPTTFTTCYNTNAKLCYRRFPDRTTTPTPESPAIVMSSNDVTVDLTSKPKNIYHQSTITFKVNSKPDQTAGTYQTVINFVATPSY